MVADDDIVAEDGGGVATTVSAAERADVFVVVVVDTESLFRLFALSTNSLLVFIRFLFFLLSSRFRFRSSRFSRFNFSNCAILALKQAAVSTVTLTSPIKTFFSTVTMLSHSPPFGNTSTTLLPSTCNRLAGSFDIKFSATSPVPQPSSKVTFS